MKKLFAIALVLMMVLALAACGNAADTPSTPAEPTIEEVVSIPGPNAPVETTEPTATGCPVCAEREEQENNNVSGDVVVEETGWEEGIGELIAPNGNVFKMPDYGCIIDEYEGRCLFAIYDQNGLWLCTAENGFVKLSGDQLVVNWTIAYDTIYWYNLDKDVWAVDWWENAEAYLYCEDAIAVSPHTDEAEGAVVDRTRPHWEYYGIPIYDPNKN